MASTDITFTVDRFAHANMVAALIHYALHVAEPSECINNLERLVPEPNWPWDEIIGNAREERRRLLLTADREVAAMREP